MIYKSISVHNFQQYPTDPHKVLMYYLMDSHGHDVHDF